MSFDKSQFIADVMQMQRIMERIEDPSTPPHHIEGYTDQVLPVAKRVGDALALLERVDDMRDALLKIMYDSEVSELSSDPKHSPFHIAYQALGGEAIAGHLVHSEQTFRDQLKHAYQK